MLHTIEGTYGISSKIPCDVFVLKDGSQYWYAVAGSHNVNCTTVELEDGVNTEEIQDINHFHWDTPIESEADLEQAVND